MWGKVYNMPERRANQEAEEETIIGERARVRAGFDLALQILRKLAQLAAMQSLNS